jgi:hypothetical protein
MVKLRCHVAREVTIGVRPRYLHIRLSCRGEDGSIGYLDNSIAMIVAELPSSQLPIDQPYDVETLTVGPFRARQEIWRCWVGEISNKPRAWVAVPCQSCTFRHVGTFCITEYVDQLT